MRKFDTKVQHLNYKVLREVARLAWDDKLLENVMDIPKKLAPGKVQNIYQALIIKHAKSVITKRPLNAVDGLRNLELCDAAHKSARKGGCKISLTK